MKSQILKEIFNKFLNSFHLKLEIVHKSYQRREEIPINTTNNTQASPRIVSDGTGGAIIVWQDERNPLTTGIDIYAQRIDSNGNFLWDPDGVAISTADDDQTLPELVSFC